MDIQGIEIFGSNIEIDYVDGTSEEIENGVYERKNASNDTIEERLATPEDNARLTSLADDFVAALAPIEATVIEIEREPGEIEVKYADGTSEEIENGVYERKNHADQKVLERPATDADIARIEALTVGAPANDTGDQQQSTDDLAGEPAAPVTVEQPADTQADAPTVAEDQTNAPDEANQDQNTGDETMEILGVELFDSKAEINYVDGTSEEVENGVYERKNASNDTVEERVATPEDIARLMSLADGFVATLDPVAATVIEIEREPGKVEVNYSDGTSEEIENGVYERKNAADQTVLERPATDADIARIEALTIGASANDDNQQPAADDQAGEPAAPVTVEQPADTQADAPTVAEDQTNAPDNANQDQNTGDETMEILGVELFDSKVDIDYVDGTSEEVENGVYERKNASNVTVEERIATAEDVARLSTLANNFVAALPPINAAVIEVEREAGKIEVKYADGTSEEIENGVYERKNAADQTVLERPATDADIARIEALGAGAPVDDNGGANQPDDNPDDTNEPVADQPDDRPEIFGDDGRDKIRGSDDGERIFGGGGRDDIRADDGNDFVDGGDGNDRIRGDDGADELIGGDGNDRLRGDDGDDVLDGGDGNDRLRGGRGEDSLSGGDGNDRVKGNGGDDIALGGDGNDRVIGGGGDDTLSGDEGNDRVKGSGGDDVVDGGGGNDRVIGGNGADTLDGGSGSDRYNGGLGADTLIFEVDGVSDKINDFEDGVDLIDVSAFGVTDIDAIIGSGQQLGLDLVLDFGGGDKITIEDTQLSQIGADDFIL